MEHGTRRRVPAGGPAGSAGTAGSGSNGEDEATSVRQPAAARQRMLLAGAALGALLPVVVAALRAVHRAWIPTWDRAYPALRAWDVFSRHSPLLGTRSSASDFGSAASHPGPLEFQALAPWVRLFGLGSGTALGVAFLNALCIVVVVWLARRRGGHVAALLAAAAMGCLAWSMGSDLLYDPWPPHVVLFPFALFLTAAWATADRDLVALPVLVLSGSFVLQTHLGYSVLIPGVTAISIGVLCWRVLAERRQSPPTPTPTPAPTPAPGRRQGARPARWVLFAVGLGVACWAFPLYEQFAGRYGGNIGSLIEDATGQRSDTTSFGEAVRIIGGTVALPPWWLPPSFGSPAVDLVGGGVSLASAVAGLSVLAMVLLIGLMRSVRRHQPAIATGLGLALATIPLAIYTADNAPTALGFRVVYLRSLWVLGAFVTMMLVLALIEEVRLRRLVPASATVAASAGLAVATIVVGIVAIPSGDRSGTHPTSPVPGVHRLADQLLPQLEGEGTVLVDVLDQSYASWVGPGLLVELQQAGVPFVVRAPALVRQLGNYRTYNGVNAELHLAVIAGPLASESNRPPQFRRARVAATLPGLTPAERDELERLRVELRDALARAGGLRLNRDPELSDNLPELRGGFETVIDEVLAVGHDPDALLDSDELTTLLNLINVGFAPMDEIIDTEGLPTDDLARYGDLRGRLTEGHVTVYLDEIRHF